MEASRLVWLLVAAVSLALASVARCDPQVPCYFIFGDSLVDNGNNNYIVSLARANYPPYGIDFAGGPSGRFTNGLTTVDVIGKHAAVLARRLVRDRARTHTPTHDTAGPGRPAARSHCTFRARIQAASCATARAPVRSMASGSLSFATSNVQYVIK
jgi:hypothetical protein